MLRYSPPWRQNPLKEKLSPTKNFLRCVGLYFLTQYQGYILSLNTSLSSSILKTQLSLSTKLENSSLHSGC